MSLDDKPGLTVTSTIEYSIGETTRKEVRTILENNIKKKLYGNFKVARSTPIDAYIEWGTLITRTIDSNCIASLTANFYRPPSSKK